MRETERGESLALALKVMRCLVDQTPAVVCVGLLGSVCVSLWGRVCLGLRGLACVGLWGRVCRFVWDACLCRFVGTCVLFLLQQRGDVDVPADGLAVKAAREQVARLVLLVPRRAAHHAPVAL